MKNNENDKKDITNQNQITLSIEKLNIFLLYSAEFLKKQIHIDISDSAPKN